MLQRLPVASRAGLLAHLAAFACLVVAYLKRNDLTLRGPLFGALDRICNASTTTATPWLIAAAALLVVGTALFVLGATRSAA